MHRYIPSTDEGKKEMLEYMGFENIEGLFSSVPSEIRIKDCLNIPNALSEMELMQHMKEMSDNNCSLSEYSCFLGAGAYDHYIPSIVKHIILRQEFSTSYTPYQAEISQGMLQAVFEYQSMICELTGMDAANASVYDGASALAEACMMACSTKGRKRVVVARSVHPESKTVLKTYSRFKGIDVSEVGYDNGRVDLDELEYKIDDNTSAIVIQSPNFFGIIEDIKNIIEIAHSRGILAIVSVDPISLALLKPPGELGADIVVGEGQSLGNDLGFGGPYLGFLAAGKKLIRKMPGRIVGQTVDKHGNRGFVLTLQAREQHIRREKAISNICSNQALNALAAAVYLTVMGKKGLKKVAEMCLSKAHYTYNQLVATGKFTGVFTYPFFKEFLLTSRVKVEEVNKRLLDRNIVGGLEVEKFYSELKNTWLVAVTEKRKREEIDRFVQESADQERK